MSVPFRNACSLIIEKITGVTNRTWIAEVTMPPIIGVAIGFITPERGPVLHLSYQEEKAKCQVRV